VLSFRKEYLCETALPAVHQSKQGKGFISIVSKWAVVTGMCFIPCSNLKMQQTFRREANSQYEDILKKVPMFPATHFPTIKLSETVLIFSGYHNRLL
jgi:hypothetical protein